MKKMFKLLVAAVATTLLGMSAAYAGGGAGNSVAATATANVITPVSITQGNGLSFGTFAPSLTSQGTIDTSGTVTGGVEKITAGNQGTFNVSGQASTNYSITGDSTVTLSDGASSDNMTAALTYPSGQQSLNSSGTASFNVAGVLTVAQSQAANAYSGTHNVTVSY